MYAPKSMTDVLIRPVEDGDRDGVSVLYSLTYNNGNPYPPENFVKWFSEDQTLYVAEQDGRIVGAGGAIHMTASRGSAILPCAGIAGVAVLPEIRRSGIGSALMTGMMRCLKEKAVPLSSLYAFREPFYRKFGYEVAGRRVKITCPATRWPKVEAPETVRRLAPSDWHELVGCYGTFAGARSGLNVRTESQWQHVLAESRPLTIYAIGDPVEAYAVVSHVSAFWTTDHISEVAWSTRRGYEGLLATLGGLAINKSGLSWFEPSDGPFEAMYLDQGIEVSVVRPIMFRVVDVQGALQMLQPAKQESGEFVIRVDDPVIPENEGPWLVQFGDGRVVVCASDRPEDIHLNVRQFAQAFLGEPSLSQIAALEGLRVRRSEALAEASRLMPPQATYCMDFF